MRLEKLDITPDQARELLGGPAGLNGHDRRSLTLVPETPVTGKPGPRPGSRLIAAGTLLLFAAAAGLLGVSFAAQYSYILAQRHQHIASLIEAGALDALLLIFSLLALGLARAGLPAKTERALVLVFACGSALMNYAAADVTSPRSVAAYVMPPIALAIVVDRCVAATRRHVLGMRDERSPWAVAGSALGQLAWTSRLLTLYALRFLVDRKGTRAGIRAAILNATPLPRIEAQQDEHQDQDEKPREQKPARIPRRRPVTAGAARRKAAQQWLDQEIKAGRKPSEREISRKKGVSREYAKKMLEAAGG